MYEIALRKQDSFEAIMHESADRQEAADFIISEIERFSGRSYEETDKEKWEDFLKWLPIDEGTTVFMCDKAPEGKEFVGSVELSLEHASVYFGANKTPRSWPYAMGVCFRHKKAQETLTYTPENFKKEFPTLAEDVLSCVQKDVAYRLMVYPKAGELYRAVTSNIQQVGEGKWLIQEPSPVGKFVPNRGIGFFDSKNNTIYVNDPKMRQKCDKKYVRICKFEVL